MEEETKTEEVQEEKKAPSMLEALDEKAARAEELLKKTEEKIRELTELQIRQRLGGQTENNPQEEKKEEKPEEYAEKALKGEL